MNLITKKVTSGVLSVNVELVFYDSVVVCVLEDLSEGENCGIYSNIKETSSALCRILPGSPAAPIVCRDRDGYYEQMAITKKKSVLLSLGTVFDEKSAVEVCREKNPFLFL